MNTVLGMRARRPHPRQYYDSARDARIPSDYASSVDAAGCDITTTVEIPANPTTMTTKGRARRIASMVFVRRRGDVSWHVRTSARRPCLILGAAPEPSIVNRYLRRCNGLETVRSRSMDFVTVVPLWCNHQAMSRCRATFRAPLRPPRLPPDRAPQCRVRRRVGATHR